VCVCVRGCVCVYICMCVSGQIFPLMFGHTRTHIHELSHTRTRTHTRTYSLMHTLAHIHQQKKIAHTPTLIYAHTDARTHLHIPRVSNVCETHMRVHTQTYTRTHTYTRKQACDRHRERERERERDTHVCDRFLICGGYDE